MTERDFVYSRIGMAIISAQRAEYVAGQVLEYLIEYDKELYGLTTSEFLEKAAKSKNGKRTLGSIFQLLKLNPKLIIESELENYLHKRNLLAHSFWRTFLNKESDEKEAIDFCYDFGRQSEKIERFFKGFLYFLALRHVETREQLAEPIKSLSNDFDFFIFALQHKDLRESGKSTD